MSARRASILWELSIPASESAGISLMPVVGKLSTADDIEPFMLAELASIPRECDSPMPDRLWSADVGEVDTKLQKAKSGPSRTGSESEPNPRARRRPTGETTDRGRLHDAAKPVLTQEAGRQP